MKVVRYGPDRIESLKVTGAILEGGLAQQTVNYRHRISFEAGDRTV
jgi:hypothetical protein